MHGTQQANYRKNRQSHRDLDNAVAHELTKRFEMRFAAPGESKLWRQPKPIRRSDRQHDREQRNLQHQKTSVFTD